MSDMPGHEFDPRLLDLHLGHLSQAEQAELRGRLAEDPALAAQNDALAAVFHVLRASPVERMPGDLPARIVARVRAAGPAPRVVCPGNDLTREVEGTSGGLIRLRSLRDMVAVAALIVLAVGVGVPSLMHVRDRQQRMGCSWNLAQLGQGLQQYARVFGSSLPFVGSSPQQSYARSSDPSILFVPNRQHVYPLLRFAYVADPRLFVCPSQRDIPMPRQEIQRRSGFLEARNVSYAYQNMAGVRPSTNDDRRLPILADDNPLFDDGLPLFDARRLHLGDPASANSRAHAGAGQNVLSLDGKVRWTTTPLCGLNDDNIWTLRGVTDYTGHEGPIAATDSHLLK